VTTHRDEIEFGEPDVSVCECCGGKTTRLTRFVTREENAFAVYFAVYSDGKHGGHVGVLVGFGPWGEEVSPSERTAFSFRIWATEDSYQVGLVDPDEDGWKTDYLGVKLNRDEALNHPMKSETFDLSDHIVECDTPIIQYLNDWQNRAS
jgi:hypothetical protein